MRSSARSTALFRFRPCRIMHVTGVTLLWSTVLTSPSLAKAAHPPLTDHRTAPSAKALPKASHPVAKPHDTSGAEAESIHVVGAQNAATGVTNTTPGGGLLPPETAAKAQQSITRDFIAKQAATSNPISLIQYTPGITLSNADAFGQSDQSSFYMRGMSQTSVGYTFEGIPIADPSSYAPFTSEASDTENISRITVQQGVADITSPVYNSVAGAIKQFMSDPNDHLGGRVNLSYGNHQLAREFVRFDTGEIGHSGVKAFASYSYGTNAQWLGPGRDRRSHIDAKLMKEWGTGNSARIFLTWTEQSFPFLMSISKAQWKASGRSAAYYDPTYTPGDVNYYALNAEQRHSIVIGAPLVFNLGHGLTFTSEPYYVHLHGAGNDGQDQVDQGYNGTRPTGNLNIPGSVDGSAPVLAVDNFNQHTAGFNNILSWKAGHNELQAGYWYNYYNQTEQAPFSVIGANGTGENFWGKYPIKDQYGDAVMQFNIHLIQQLNSLFVSDTYKMFNDKLTLNAGLKFVMMSYRSTNLIPGDGYNYGRDDAQPLPQFSASYQITPHDQVYLDGATAFREPSGILVYGNYWDAGAPVMDMAHSTGLKPEYSISEEIGYRHTGLVNVTASLFNYNMTNRQSSITAYTGGRLVSQYVNAGGQTTRGAQIAIGLRPWHGLSPYASFQYLHSTMDNNLPDGTDYVRTAGKTAIYSPAYTANFGLSYDDGNFFANGYMSYVGSQYSTFMNDEKLPGYAIGNATLGYRLKKIWIAKSPQIQINALNLTDNKYLASGGGSFNAHPVKGVYGSTLKGSSPLYTVGGGFGLVFSISSGF